jgi:hypothetical protein
MSPRFLPYFGCLITGLLCVFVGVDAGAVRAQDTGSAVSLDGGAWRVAPQAEVADSGVQISLPGYAAHAWVAAQVPGTVFGSYVNDHLEKDPIYGDNIDHVSRPKYDRNYWYRTEFRVPSGGGHLWLNFGGVNRDADVYVNGTHVGGMKGFLQRGRFDITNLVHAGQPNGLAVLAHVPVGGGNSSSPSFICSQGWDWMPYVPGRNMGIYKDVFLTRTGPVSLADPWIRTRVPSLKLAYLSVQVGLVNSDPKPVTGVLSGMIEPGHIAFSQRVSVGTGATRLVTLDRHTVAAFVLHHPRLWWPDGYGAPNLYSCQMAFRVGAKVSDAKTVSFGVRQYTYDTEGGILHFHVNGVHVFPKGGNWGMAEFMLRSHGSDYDTRLRFHHAMHFNMIRNWMGMTADDAFYSACDKYGVMVWDGFWLNSGGSLPSDVNVYQANAIEKIKQVRDHACVALWCGENEGVPTEPVNSLLRQDVLTYDDGDRRYQPNSHAGDLSGSGPWHDLGIKQYFHGVSAYGNGDPYGMRSEVGTATVTTFDSFKRFMPRKDWWPRDAMWNVHYLGPNAGNAGPDGYNGDIDGRYGAAGGIQDYCRKAQFLNLQTMKAIYEGWLDHINTDGSGVLIWMSQSAYPSFVWQTYDYYYGLTGAYWGARSACEPVHIYWNADNDHIRVVNTSRVGYPHLRAEAWIYNMDGSLRYHHAAAVASVPGRMVDCFALHFPAGLSAVHFIKLRLTEPSGKVLSDNFYWRGKVYQNYTALNDIARVHLQVKSRLQETATGQDTLTATITNPAGAKAVAFAVRPLAVLSTTSAPILPAFPSDGYFSLIPGESKTVTIEFARPTVGRPRLSVDCWNNDPHYRAPVDVADLALNRPAIASSIEPAGAGPGASVDGEASTRWSSAWGIDPQWIQVDLGKIQPISRVILMWETACASSFQIQVSNDAVHWTDIYATTDGKGGTEDLTGLHGQGRYVRMYGTKRATQWGYSLYEFKVYGPSAPGPTMRVPAPAGKK